MEGGVPHQDKENHHHLLPQKCFTLVFVVIVVVVIIIICKTVLIIIAIGDDYHNLCNRLGIYDDHHCDEGAPIWYNKHVEVKLEMYYISTL